MGDVPACDMRAHGTGEAMWTPIADDGRAVARQPVELGQDDREDDMTVELHTDVGCIASAVAKIADIWAVSIGCSTPPAICRLKAVQGCWHAMQSTCSESPQCAAS